ncbi:MAG TPA: hypothetical protein PLB32_16265 [Acidobacteriota bacterium]|nr:hypothetical protein [Acidobacteriota bacterium]
MRKTTLKSATLYLTESELAGLKREASDQGVTLSYFLRALIDQYTPYQLPPLNRQGAPFENTNRKGKPNEHQTHD